MPDPKVDLEADTVLVDTSDLIRVDGVVVGKRVVRDGQVFLQVRDKDRARSRDRGTRHIEVPLETLTEKLSETGGDDGSG